MAALDRRCRPAAHGGEPVQLISIDDAGQCHLQADAAERLQQIPGQLAVVGIAGLYRTGKSFLLNRLLGQQDGFEIGPTVNPCTKGIWMWGEPIRLGSNVHCVLIDTEGLGSTQRTASCDMQIFSLCVLLSSYFIYNSMGSIDEQAIDDLHLVLNLAKHVHAKSSCAGDDESSTELSQHFPSFLWVVRDFHLKLADEQGRAITEREYLERALSANFEQEEKNRVRATIRHLFPERDCATLVRPVAEEDELRHVEQLPYESLRPQFRAQVEAFVNKVLMSARPKHIGGAMVSGATFAGLAAEYCKAINSSAVPTIQSAWTSVISHQLRLCLKEAVRTYRARMNDRAMGHLPMDVAQLRDVHRAAEAEALRVFLEPGLDEADPKVCDARDELAQRISQLCEYAETENVCASKQQCQDVAEQVYSELIEGKLSCHGSYGSFEELTRDWELVREAYLQRTAGPAQAEVLAGWLLQRMTESMQRVHDQLRSATDAHRMSLQEQHAVALEQQRDAYSSTLQQAQQEWFTEKKKLQRRLERAAPAMDAQRWRQTHGFPPALKAGAPPVPARPSAAAGTPCSSQLLSGTAETPPRPRQSSRSRGSRALAPCLSDGTRDMEHCDDGVMNLAEKFEKPKYVPAPDVSSHEVRSECAGGQWCPLQ